VTIGLEFSMEKIQAAFLSTVISYSDQYMKANHFTRVILGSS
jgi:hypothetical protein